MAELCNVLFALWVMGGIFRFLYLLEDCEYPPSRAAVGGIIWPVTGGIYLVQQAIAEIKNATKKNG